MRVPAFLLSVLLAAQLAAFPSAAGAVPVSFSPDLGGTTGKVTAKIPMEKLGSVVIPSGRLKIKRDWAEVSTVQEFQFDRSVVLAGPVINTTQRTERGKLEINGLAYFSDGDWLAYLSPGILQETVSTDSGELVGRITAINHEQAQIRLLSGQTQTVPLLAIKNIHSPRAFRFIIAALPPSAVPAGQSFETDATKLTMLQTTRQFRATALRTDLRKQGDGDLTTGQLVAIGSLIAGLQIGQMAPFIAVPLQYNRLNQTALRREFETLTNPLGITPTVLFPNYTVPPPPGVQPAPALPPAIFGE